MPRTCCSPLFDPPEESLKKFITVGALSLMVLGGVANCDMRACNDGTTDQRGGKPREGSKVCNDRKARMTPTEVS